MRVNNQGFVEKITSARKGDNASTYRDWWMVKQHVGRSGGIVELGKLSLPSRFVGKKIMIRVVIKGGVLKRDSKRIVWEELEKGTWESNHKDKYDFSITKEGKRYVLDIFDATIKNSNKAYIETIGCKTLREAKKEAKDYEEDN